MDENVLFHCPMLWSVLMHSFTVRRQTEIEELKGGGNLAGGMRKQGKFTGRNLTCDSHQDPSLAKLVASWGNIGAMFGVHNCI